MRVFPFRLEKIFKQKDTSIKLRKKNCPIFNVFLFHAIGLCLTFCEHIFRKGYFKSAATDNQETNSMKVSSYQLTQTI